MALDGPVCMSERALDYHVMLNDCGPLEERDGRFDKNVATILLKFEQNVAEI